MYEKLKRSEDWDFSLRISKYCIFDFVPEVLVRYRTFGDSLTKQNGLLDETIYSVLDKVYNCEKLPVSIILLRKKAYALRCLDYISCYLNANRIYKVFFCFFKALLLYPQGIKLKHLKTLLKSIVRKLF